MTAASAVPADIRAAYQHCEQVTSTQARNFSYGIRLLPAPKRRALSAVYAFARRIDDIGDGTLPAAQKLTALQEARQQLAALADDVARGGPAAAVQAETGQTGTSPARTSPNGTSPNGTSPNGTGQTGTSQTGTSPNETSQAGLGQAGASQNEAGPAGHPADLVLVALGDAARRYPIPLAAFGELIEGCEADVRGTAYATFSDLEHYCRCVAGSIGRLSLGIFGSRELDRAVPLADALGIALQLTNILRDIREDYGTGRVYLPAEDLASFGCALTPAAQGGQAELPAQPGAGAAGPLPGAAGAALVLRRAGPAATAGPQERRLHGRDGRYLPAAAGADFR